MVIDAREPQVLVRPSAKRVDQLVARRRDVDFAAGDAFEQIVELFV